MTCLVRVCVAVMLTGVLSSAVRAHVALDQSMDGATAKYAVRVLTEGKVVTVGTEIDVPEAS